jgi:hypothetical protein
MHDVPGQVALVFFERAAQILRSLGFVLSLIKERSI